MFAQQHKKETFSFLFFLLQVGLGLLLSGKSQEDVVNFSWEKLSLITYLK